LGATEQRKQLGVVTDASEGVYRPTIVLGNLTTASCHFQNYLAALFRQVQRLSKDLGEKAPSYGTVFSIVRDLGTDLVTLAHEGTKAYSNTFELVHRREATGPNAVWQADHTPLDILLIRPDGEPAKPWLSIVIDDYSRAVAGYFLSF
jgi:putative transposase